MNPQHKARLQNRPRGAVAIDCFIRSDSCWECVSSTARASSWYSRHSNSAASFRSAAATFAKIATIAGRAACFTSSSRIAAVPRTVFDDIAQRCLAQISMEFLQSCQLGLQRRECLVTQPGCIRHRWRTPENPIALPHASSNLNRQVHTPRLAPPLLYRDHFRIVTFSHVINTHGDDSLTQLNVAAPAATAQA